LGPRTNFDALGEKKSPAAAAAAGSRPTTPQLSNS